MKPSSIKPNDPSFQSRGGKEFVNNRKKYIYNRKSFKEGSSNTNPIEKDDDCFTAY